MSKQRVDVQQKITDRIIAALEHADGSKWQRPWVGGGAGIPTNATTGKAYRGGNMLALMLEDRPSNQWATYRQWQSIGAQVRKGERGAHILVYREVEDKERTNEDGTPAKRIFAKAAAVFSAEQVDGYDVDVDLPDVAEVVPALDALAAAAGPALISTDQQQAWYRLSTDEVNMPDRARFLSTEGYYGTLLHELAHSTMTAERCNRSADHTNKTAYAYEELVAELTSAMLAAHYGIKPEPDDNNAEYIAAWLRALKDDKTYVMTAARDAAKATDYLIGRTA